MGGQSSLNRGDVTAGDGACDEDVAFAHVTGAHGHACEFLLRLEAGGIRAVLPGRRHRIIDAEAPAEGADIAQTACAVDEIALDAVADGGAEHVMAGLYRFGNRLRRIVDHCAVALKFHQMVAQNLLIIVKKHRFLLLLALFVVNVMIICKEIEHDGAVVLRI